MIKQQETNLLAVPMAAALLAVGCAASAHAEAPAVYCRHIGTDDTTRPIPGDLVPAVNAAFGMRLPAHEAIAATVFRCTSGRVLVCTIGANLPCGKANTARTPNAGMAQWCHDDSDAAFIPAAATGHETVYEWRCRAGLPLIVRQTLRVDAEGFIADFWKVLP